LGRGPAPALRGGGIVAAEQLRVLEPHRREPAGLRSRFRRISRRVRRTSVLAGFLLFACLLFPREPSFEVMTLREGFPAKRDLIAPFQFYLLKAKEGLHQEQVAATRAVAPVFSSDESVETRAETDSPVARVERAGVRVATPWALLYDLPSIRDMAWNEGQRAFPSRPEAAQALQELASAVIQPDLRFEASTTEALRAEARDAVNQYDGVVRKDEKIIGSHEIATRDHILKLESLRAWSTRVQGILDWRSEIPGLLGRLALIAFLLAGFLGYLKLHHPSVYRDTSMLLLLAILTAAVMGVGWVVVNQIRGYEMLIPVTVLSLSVAVLFGQEMAFVATLVASLLVAVVYGLGLPFLTGSALAGIAAIATASGVRRRRDFYLPMLVVALAYAIAIGAMGLVDGARWDVLLRRSAWGIVAGFG